MSSRRVREMLRQRRIEVDKSVEKGRQIRNLDNLTKTDLVRYAEENGIEIDKTAKKAEILERIKDELRRT